MIKTRFLEKWWWWRPWRGIKNVLRWAPVIWDDVDWDWIALATVMEYKLRRMSHLELTVGHHTTSRKDSRDQLVCAELLKRLQDDNYFDKANEPFGKCRDSIRRGVKNAIADQKLLGKLLGKHLTSWWD